jgi:hypothetical protein
MQESGAKFGWSVISVIIVSWFVDRLTPATTPTKPNESSKLHGLVYIVGGDRQKSHFFGEERDQLFPDPDGNAFAPYKEPIQSKTTKGNCKPIANSSPFKD